MKKRILLFCLILIFVSVSAVSANEDLNQTIDEDTLSLYPEDSDIIAVDSGTFGDLQSKIDAAQEGSSITLDRDYLWDEEFNDSVTINKTLTIDGKNHIIDGLRSSRIFVIEANNVTLKNIQLINGYFQGYGGAIWTDGNGLVFDNCKFINNTGNNGGVLYTKGKNTTIKNSLFEYNHASVYGGAIFMGSSYEKYLTIDNVVFNGNSAEDGGGAIYAPCGYAWLNTIYAGGAPLYTVTSRFPNHINIVGKSKFTNNSAYDGGAILMQITEQSALNYDVAGQIIVEKGVVFENNSATYGGALSLENANTTITGAIFKNNSGIYGGAIYTSYFSNMKIDSSIFTENFGGAIDASNNLDVVNSKFSRSSLDVEFIYYHVDPDGDFPDGKLYVDNNQMTGINDFDICFSGNLPMEFQTYLVFENKTARPNEGVNLGELRDGDGNSIWIREINVTLTKVGNSKITDSATLTFDYFNWGYYYDGTLARGVYKVTGSVSDEISTSNTVVDGYLSIVDYEIDVADVTKDYKGPERLEITLTENNSPIADVQINITINGLNYYRTTDSKGKVSLPINLLSGNYTAIVSYGDVSATAKIIVNPLSTKTSLTYEKTSRDDVTLTASVSPSTATGFVVFNVNGDESTVSISDSKATLTLKDLDAGDYTVKATYQGDTNHKSSSSSKVEFTVEDYYIVVSAPNVTKNYGGNEKLAVTVTDNSNNPISNAQVSVQLNGKTLTKKTDSKGKVSFDLDLDSDSYDAVVTCEGVSTTAKVIVKQLSSKTSLTYTKDANDAVTLTASVSPSDASGKVVFNINGEDKAVNIKNSKATLTLKDLDAGDYTVKATYQGDTNHKSSSSSKVKFTVEDYYIVVSAPDLVKYYGGNERFVVSVTDNEGNPVADEPVKVIINGQTYNHVTGDEGKTTFAINLNSGKYNVTTEHDGEVITSTITVKSTVKGHDVTKIFRNGTDYVATFYDTNGKKVTAGEKVDININGVFYKRTVKDDGSISFALNLEQGTYILTLTNPVTGENIASTVKVLPNIVENNNLTKYYKNDSQFTFKLLDDKGRPAAGQKASININGVFYTRTTNDKGIATFQINLEPGTYILTMEYKGCRVSNTVKVLNVIKTSDVKMKYQDGTRFKVIILDGKGKAYANQKVTLNINGVLYPRVTNADGVASLAINLNPDEYTITTSYNGLNAANKVIIEPNNKDNSQSQSNSQGQNNPQTQDNSENKDKLDTHFVFQRMSYIRAANGALQGVSILVDLVDENGNILTKPISGVIKRTYLGSTSDYGPVANGTSGSSLYIRKWIGSWTFSVFVKFDGDDRYNKCTYRQNI